MLMCGGCRQSEINETNHSKGRKVYLIHFSPFFVRQDHFSAVVKDFFYKSIEKTE